jgi:hypothetical protein
MFPDVLMHTSPLYLPTTLNPAVLAVTLPENFSAEGLEVLVLENPGHFFPETIVSAGGPNVAVFPLSHVTTPPVARAAAEIG